MFGYVPGVVPVTLTLTAADAGGSGVADMSLVDGSSLNCADADYQPYVDTQQRVDETWRDPQRWTRMSVLNAARMGKFSSDRSIRDYCEKIWKVSPMPVEMKKR